MKTRGHLDILAALLILGTVWADAAPIRSSHTYQGRLHDNGTPASGDYIVRFGLFDQSEGGINLGTFPPDGVSQVVRVTNGLFTTDLDFGFPLFNGEARFLQVAVRTNNPAITLMTPLFPRQELKATPYALFARTAGETAHATNADFAAKVLWGSTSLVGLPPGFADGVDQDHIYNEGPGLQFTGNSVGGTFSLDTTFTDLRYWKLGGNGGTTAGVHFLGTSDPSPLELKANNERILRLEATGRGPNVIGGSRSNLVSASAVGGVIGGGGHAMGNPAPLDERNHVSDDFSTISGGARNVAGNTNSIPADARYATVAGGYSNQARGPQSTIAGGRGNRALGLNSTVGGGSVNQALGESAAVAGGFANTNELAASIIAGGQQNFIGTNIYDGGDFFVTNHGAASAVLGGQLNRVSSSYAGISSGYGNGVYGDYGTVGGGFANRVGSPGLPAATLQVGTIGGGSRNQIWGDGATIAGGELNEAAGLWSAVPGGAFNSAAGRSSLAAGWKAKANHDGSFVWADGTDADFASTGPNQFRVRASGGAFFEGQLTVQVLTITGGADLAEPFPISTVSIAPGALVIIDDQHPGHLRMSDKAYDTRIAGIVSGANGIKPGIMLYQQGALQGSRNVALTGRVYALADATDASIQPGDLLTTSATPGHAMKVTEPSRGTGAILGKAMTGLKSGQGLILVLVSLQ